MWSRVFGAQPAPGAGRGSDPVRPGFFYRGFGFHEHTEVPLALA